ncbi:MAG: GNAT family N-acetyltransferase [Candidatus Sulfotelmatobacter sp.]
MTTSPARSPQITGHRIAVVDCPEKAISHPEVKETTTAQFSVDSKTELKIELKKELKTGLKTGPKTERKTAYAIDPLVDRRWEELVQTHLRASVFHSSAWLKALSRTYQYEPIAYTTSPAGQKLENALVLCRIQSWLTGRRLVSLPFSDHCEPLVDAREDLDAIMAALEQDSRERDLRYIELRPLQPIEIETSLRHSTVPYTFHQLDLAPGLPTLFANCHKNSTQRKILRAEREGLRYREGSSEEFVEHFYGLHTITRRRHRRPPQPRKWFVNLIDCFGDALKIRVAFKVNRPVAAVITIRHKGTMVYKYGGSDPRFNHLGSMHLLLWAAIEEAKTANLQSFDFGRTDADQKGLITFKKRWGSTQSDMVYSRYALSEDVAHMFEASGSWKSRVAKHLLSRMQPGILSVVGRALYRHVG